MTALPDLAAVDWSSLEHAYGPALDTPKQLEALGSSDAKTRSAALAKLEETIHHQTETYSASAASVPFLVALACDRDYPDRVPLLHFLAGLAVGEPRPIEGFDVRSNEGRAALTARDGGVATYDAVSKTLPQIARLLSDETASVRAATAFVLAQFADRAAESLRVVRSALDSEPDVQAATSLLLALRLLARFAGDPTVTADLEQRVAKGKPTDPAAQAAAIARLDIAGAHAPAETLLAKMKPFKKAPGFLWGDLRPIATWVIDGLGLDQPIEKLIEAVEDPVTTPGRRRNIVLRTLPSLLIKQRGSYLLPEELGNEARRLLAAASRTHAITSDELDFFYDRRSVPETHEHPRWLELETGGKLERRLAHGDRSWPTWKWIHAAIKGEIEPKLAASVIADAFDDDERLDLVFPASQRSQLAYRYNFRCYYDARQSDDIAGVRKGEERRDEVIAEVLATCSIDRLVAQGQKIDDGPLGVDSRALLVAVGRVVHASKAPYLSRSYLFSCARGSFARCIESSSRR